MFYIPYYVVYNVIRCSSVSVCRMTCEFINVVNISMISRDNVSHFSLACTRDYSTLFHTYVKGDGRMLNETRFTKNCWLVTESYHITLAFKRFVFQERNPAPLTRWLTLAIKAQLLCALAGLSRVM